VAVALGAQLRIVEQWKTPGEQVDGDQHDQHRDPAKPITRYLLTRRRPILLGEESSTAVYASAAALS